jgi:hypothetical protein
MSESLLFRSEKEAFFEKTFLGSARAFRKADFSAKKQKG